MSKGKDLPIVSPTTSLSQTLIEISSKGLGVSLVIENNDLIGIFTDGDLRRTLNNQINPLDTEISKFMTKKQKLFLKIGWPLKLLR